MGSFKEFSIIELSRFSTSASKMISFYYILRKSKDFQSVRSIWTFTQSCFNAVQLSEIHLRNRRYVFAVSLGQFYLTGNYQKQEIGINFLTVIVAAYYTGLAL